MLDDRLAESPTFFCVSQRAIIGRTGHADGLCGYADPPAFQIRERNLQPLPFLTEHLLGKHLAVLENNVAVIRTALVHRVLVTRYPGRTGRHDKGGDALLSGVRIGHRKYDRKVGTLARRNELLASIEHERVAAAPRARLDRRSIGARVWLGQAECPQQFTGCQRTQVASLLVLVAVVKQGEADQRVVHLECRRGRAIGGGDLYDGQRVGNVVESRAAILLRYDHAHHAKSGHLVKHLTREPRHPIPLGGTRRELLSRELPHHCTRLTLRFREHRETFLPSLVPTRGSSHARIGENCRSSYWRK